MDLIYTDEFKTDVDVLKNYELDIAIGSEENNFTLTVDSNSHVMTRDCFFYFENTEFGGIVDDLDVDTNLNTVMYWGRSFHGILSGKIICPDAGEDHLIVSGNANQIIEELVSRIGLEDYFSVIVGASGINIQSYQFERYINAYDGICDMLKKNNGKLKMYFKDGKIILEAVPLVDYSEDEQWDSSQLKFKLTKVYNQVNHLICLGKGELKEREVIHLYKDDDGVISQTQTFFGINEITDIYDNPTTEQLLEDGTKDFENRTKTDSLELKLSSQENIYDIGDKVGAYDNVTKLSATAYIVKKILKIDGSSIEVECEVK